MKYENNSHCNFQTNCVVS
uniref:Uncharacterized protein n=1 Tax=Rhizophora mucronata TaxID=61149 RepID=A0A2P2NLI3_RHIMU